MSIGLPIYDSEKFMRETIDSILVETFTDFELIISDNASTESTEYICQEYVAKYSRVGYYKNDILGGTPNYHHTFELSTGEYFK